MSSKSLWRPWIGVALLFFFFAALLGLVLRYFFIEEVPFSDYRNMLHSHSHTALLGWGYMLLTGGLFISYGIDTRGLSVFRKLLYVHIVCVIGMMIAFALEGYGPISITFSAIHLIASYVYAWHYLRYLRTREKSSARLFIQWAIYWQLVSTIGLWALGPVMVFLGKLHPLYSGSIQFFLHFQLNGWFIFLFLGLLFAHLSKRGHSIKISARTFLLLQISLVCTYFLSVTFTTPIPALFIINSIGVSLQLWAFVCIFKELRRHNPDLFSFQKLPTALLSLGLISVVFKVILQSLLVVPQLAVISYTIHNYVVGFIHLIMLGSVTFGMGGILTLEDKLSVDFKSRFGWRVVVVGFVLMEIVLFGQGILLWAGMGFITHYYELIFGVSALLPIGIGMLFWGQISSYLSKRGTKVS